MELPVSVTVSSGSPEGSSGDGESFLPSELRNLVCG
jgi:hypothetical protein